MTTAGWLSAGGVPCLAVCESPGAPTAGGVLIVPPFGWDAVCSHRARRDWARDLAERGHLVLRVDLPSTADASGSPRDPDRVGAWLDAVRAGVAALREAGVSRVTAIGLGLGGMLAVRAAADGVPIDELVLWGVPHTGAALRRELRAFSRLEAAEFASHGPAPEGPGDGDVLAGGFLLTAETLAAIDAIDLPALGAPGGLRRGLLLDRDGIAPAAELVTALGAAGADVRVAAGPGWAAMMDRPHESKAPEEVFATVGDWLGPAEAGAAEPVELAPRAEVAPGVHERVVTLPTAQGACFAVVAEPDTGGTDHCAVLLNAGAIPRFGPNRMWTEAARRWAAAGVAAVRVDLPGIGDAEGRLDPIAPEMGLYIPEFVQTIDDVLDGIEAAGLPGRFALGGLCSGAYWAFHAVRRDERVAAVAVVNPRVLLLDVRERWVRTELEKVGDAGAWRKVLRGQVGPGALATRAARLFRHQAALLRAEREPRLQEILDDLREQGRHVVFAFAAGEPLEEELGREGVLDSAQRWPNVAHRHDDHYDHTLRPLPLQRWGHAVLDEVVGAVRA